MRNCVFCDIVAGQAEAKFVASWEHSIAIIPRDPVTGTMENGHVLVLPREHVIDFIDDPVVTGRVMTDAAIIAWQLKRAHGGDWNLITSAGADATQTVFHLHVHLVRRVANDGLTLPWTGQHKPVVKWADDPRNLFNL